MRFGLLIFILCFSVLAQHSEQPTKEDTSDLRSQTTLFSIEDVKVNKVYWLERSENMDYFLRLKKGDTEEIRKIGSRDAKKLDLDFASRFLRCQYEVDAVPGECMLTHRLSMKGETQEICTKDDRKAQEIAPFLNSLSKRF